MPVFFKVSLFFSSRELATLTICWPVYFVLTCVLPSRHVQRTLRTLYVPSTHPTTILTATQIQRRVQRGFTALAYYSGVFKWTPEVQHFKNMWQKMDDENLWLRCTETGKWLLSTTAMKDEPDESKGLAVQIKHGLLDATIPDAGGTCSNLCLLHSSIYILRSCPCISPPKYAVSGGMRVFA